MQTPTIKSLDKFLCLKRADLLALCKRKKITNCRKFRRSEIITILTHYDTTNRREWVRAKKVTGQEILDHYKVWGHVPEVERKLVRVARLYR